MTWYERRSRFISACENEPGYGTPRMMSDRHIGRVLMRPLRIGPALYKAGFHSQRGPAYDAIGHYLHAKHRKATLGLPK